MMTLDRSLAALADKIGIGMDRLYQALLKQAYIARVESLMLLLIVIAALFVVRWIWRWAQRLAEEGRDEIVYLFPIAAAILTVVLLVASFLELSMYIAAWYNPDGWIVLKILQVIK